MNRKNPIMIRAGRIAAKTKAINILRDEYTREYSAGKKSAITKKINALMAERDNLRTR